MSDDSIFPKYLSENCEIGDSFVLRRKYYGLAEEGEVVTLVAMDTCKSEIATSGGFYRDGLLFVFCTPKGLKKIEVPRFGTFDHAFLSILSFPIGK